MRAAPRYTGWPTSTGSACPSDAKASEDDGVPGFVSVSPSRDPDLDPGFVGEIQAVYLLPEYWGQGVGQLLMAAGLRRLGEAGYHEVTLWVLETNWRARRFYEAGGWRVDGSTKTDSSRGFRLAEIRYCRCRSTA
ncbi:GNAT family N-acetyltransferase [Polymorphospora rubra]|uniref:GNAT family N-acetyltransferase n=1 Tax=Polymorphospora rubra TaxID=338584 RepID=UPI002484D1BF|nr:GNAT family N-acetyltransferase [Polymorphospora rubra]